MHSSFCHLVDDRAYSSLDLECSSWLYAYLSDLVHLSWPSSLVMKNICTFRWSITVEVEGLLRVLLGGELAVHVDVVVLLLLVKLKNGEYVFILCYIPYPSHCV